MRKFSDLAAAASESSVLAVAQTSAPGDPGFAGAIVVEPALAARIIEASLDLPAPEGEEEERPLTRVDEALPLLMQDAEVVVGPVDSVHVAGDVDGEQCR